jgi:small subunit ribosomal protein S18
MARRKSRRATVKKIRDYCYFCKEGKKPDYKDYETLAMFLSDRARILGKKRSGVCSRHQRRLSVAIKRARHLGLLPFSPTL